MAKILEHFGFKDEKVLVKKLCGQEATAKEILAAWEDLISKASPNDTVVIYYSGHGASTRLDAATIQFLVPSDFNDSPDEFHGILDSQISKLLQRLTDITHNVTYILDCCHSAGLGRAPPLRSDTERWEKAWSFSEISEQKFDAGIIARHMESLRSAGELLENNNWSNPSVVRIYAAGAHETAWQYLNRDLVPVGIMTEKLILMLREASREGENDAIASCELSWRSIILGVKAHVELEFPNREDIQKPRAAGAATRMPFRLISGDSTALLAVCDWPRVVLHGGRMHGVHEGDKFILVPFRPERPVKDVIATVNVVNGFKSSMCMPKEQPSFTRALALPYERQTRWPVSCPPELQNILGELKKSKFLIPATDGTAKIQIERQGDQILLYGQGVQIGTARLNDPLSIGRLLSTARTFAVAQELLSVDSGKEAESFNNVGMEIDIGVVIDGRDTIRLAYKHNQKPPRLSLTADEEFYITLKKLKVGEDDGVEEFEKVSYFVLALRVDAAGKITLINAVRGFGTHMEKYMGMYRLRRGEFEGIPIQWPKGIPARGTVNETFVFVITEREEDLQSLDTSTPADYVEVQKKGDRRESRAAATKLDNRFRVIQIPYTLCWPDGADAREPVETSAHHCIEEATASEKGVIGGLYRRARGISPSV
jgi:hypothetical protein